MTEKELWEKAQKRIKELGLENEKVIVIGATVPKELEDFLGGAFDAIVAACQEGKKNGLFPEKSGNVSARMHDPILAITPAGADLGELTRMEIPFSNFNGNYESIVDLDEKPSTERRLHGLVYETFKNIKFIIHSHPENLIALAEKLENDMDKFLNLNSPKAKKARRSLCIAERAEPGTPDVGRAAVEAMLAKWGKRPALPCAIWLTGHGLCVAGENGDQCLRLSMLLESLAKEQLGA